VVISIRGRITEVNRACEKLSGFALDEIRGRTMWNVLAVPEEVKLLEDICRAVQHGVSPVECESQLMTKHSARRWIAGRWPCSPIRRRDPMDHRHLAPTSPASARPKNAPPRRAADGHGRGQVERLGRNRRHRTPPPAAAAPIPTASNRFVVDGRCLSGGLCRHPVPRHRAGGFSFYSV